MQFTQTVLGVLLLMCFLPLSSQAQELLKEEKERRIKFNEIPQSAQDYLENWLDKSRRVRYYYETDAEHSSYEAKLIRDRRRFSIEFDEAGKLEDIEELIDFNQISDTVKQAIHSFLIENYGKYSVQRVQRQFLASQSKSYTQLTEEKIGNYELEINLTEKSRLQSYEMLFDASGRLKQKRLIVRRSLDNFLY